MAVDDCLSVETIICSVPYGATKAFLVGLIPLNCCHLQFPSSFAMFSHIVVAMSYAFSFLLVILRVDGFGVWNL